MIRSRWMLPLALPLLLVASGCARRAQQPAPAAGGAQAAEARPPDRNGAAGIPTPASTPGGVGLQLEPVFFGFDSWTLSAEGREILDRVARELRRDPLALTIEGHCDERGTAEYNLALGENRARAVRDYLVAAGAPGAAIGIVSYGKERPFAEGHHESAWAQNRRAHLVAQAPAP